MSINFTNIKDKYKNYFSNMEHHLEGLTSVLAEEKHGRIKTAGESSNLIIKVITELSRLLPLISLDVLKGKEELTATQKKSICDGIMKFLDDIFETMNKTIPLLRDTDIDDKIYEAIRPSIQEFILCNLDRINLITSCCF